MHPYAMEELARRRKLRTLGIIQDRQLANDAAYPCSALSAEDEFLMHVPDDHVLRALRQLPDAFRTVVCLADMEGYTYQEIADLIGAPVGTVMSRLHRGRCQLLEHLRPAEVRATDQESSCLTSAS